MNYSIGFLIGFIGMFVLPAIIVLILGNRLSEKKAKSILMWCLTLFTLGIGVSQTAPALKALCIPIGAVVYIIVYLVVSKRAK